MSGAVNEGAMRSWYRRCVSYPTKLPAHSRSSKPEILMPMKPSFSADESLSFLREEKRENFKDVLETDKAKPLLGCLPFSPTLLLDKTLSTTDMPS